MSWLDKLLCHMGWHHPYWDGAIFSFESITYKGICTRCKKDISKMEARH